MQSKQASLQSKVAAAEGQKLQKGTGTTVRRLSFQHLGDKAIAAPPKDFQATLSKVIAMQRMPYLVLTLPARFALGAPIQQPFHHPFFLLKCVLWSARRCLVIRTSFWLYSKERCAS